MRYDQPPIATFLQYLSLEGAGTCHGAARFRFPTRVRDGDKPSDISINVDVRTLAQRSGLYLGPEGSDGFPIFLHCIPTNRNRLVPGIDQGDISVVRPYLFHLTGIEGLQCLRVRP